VFIAWDPNPEPHVTGYKLHYGTSSRDYTTVIDVGLTTEVELPGLEPQRLYFCAITAYDDLGFESDLSVELPIVQRGSGVAPTSQGGGIIVIDTTLQGSISTGMPSSDELPGNDSRELNVAFNSESGSYFTWVKVRFESDASPLNVNIDGALVGVAPLQSSIETFDPSSQAYQAWIRVTPLQGSPTSVEISAGSHVLTIPDLEPGTEIERVILSTNEYFVPSEDTGHTGDAVSIIRQPGQTNSAFEGSSLTLQVDVISTGPTRYQWFKDGYAIIGETAQNLELDPLELEDVGSYTALISSGQASAATAPSLIIIIEQPFGVASMTVGGENSVDFMVTGKQGAIISVYGSDDMESWSLISTHYNQDGSVKIVDPEASGKTRRFYRLEAP
jgi:hypothetical protein